MQRSPQVRLRSEDREFLSGLLRGGIAPVRVIKHAQVLWHLDQGHSPPQAAAAIGVSPKTARRIGRRYREGTLADALEDRPRPGGAPLLRPREAQRIIAMVCGPPPEGQARWSVRLIASEAVNRKLVPHVGRETIRVLLQNHELKPWREKNVVRARDHARVSGAHGGCARTL